MDLLQMSRKELEKEARKHKVDFSTATSSPTIIQAIQSKIDGKPISRKLPAKAKDDERNEQNEQNDQTESTNKGTSAAEADNEIEDDISKSTNPAPAKKNKMKKKDKDSVPPIVGTEDSRVKNTNPPVCPICKIKLESVSSPEAFTRYACPNRNTSKGCTIKVKIPKASIGEILKRQQQSGLNRIIARDSQMTEADLEQHR